MRHVVCAALMAGGLCLAQQPMASELPILPLGRGDVINVTVGDEADLSRRLKISDKGEIAMPLLKDPLRVDGLLPADIEALIAEAYRREKLLIDPLVTVRPAEYHSYLVRITGEAAHPYEFQALERVSLLDVLAKAGGPTMKSNGTIEVIRRDRETAAESKQTIAIRTLLEGTDPSLNVALKGGDEVRLPAGTPAPQ
jgi:protein involved in polysaccharide export with SLBB domain